MSSFKNQSLDVRYVYDFAEDGGAVGLVALYAKANHQVLPVGMVVRDFLLYVETAFTSGGSATLDVGNTDDADGYAAAIAVAALTANSVHSTGAQAGALVWDDTNDHRIYPYVADAADGQMGVTIGTAAMTAGKAHLVVSGYVVPV